MLLPNGGNSSGGGGRELCAIVPLLRVILCICISLLATISAADPRGVVVGGVVVYLHER